MAQSTLPSLTRSNFPQVFSNAIDQMVARIAAHPQLGQCWFEDEHCDCRQPAVVHDLATEREFCARHFSMITKEVSRG